MDTYFLHYLKIFVMIRQLKVKSNNQGLNLIDISAKYNSAFYLIHSISYTYLFLNDNLCKVLSGCK
jgi:hypothetical protein